MGVRGSSNLIALRLVDATQYELHWHSVADRSCLVRLGDLLEEAGAGDLLGGAVRQGDVGLDASGNHHMEVKVDALGAPRDLDAPVRTVEGSVRPVDPRSGSRLDPDPGVAGF